MSDARVRYTKRIIRETFLDLLREKDVPSITVKEICEKAGVNRTTFYNHYCDIYDLLEDTENALIESLLDLIRRYRGRDAQQILLIILKEISKHAEEFRHLLDRSSTPGFLYRIASECFMEIYKINSDTAAEGSGSSDPGGARNFLYTPMNFSYFAGGIGGVVAYWVGNGLKESPEEIADAIRGYHDTFWKGLKH